MFSQQQGIVTSCFLDFLTISDIDAKNCLQQVKNFKKPQKSLEKHGSRAHISPISLLKSNRFSKSHIYSERGNSDASSRVKNSTSDFFEKLSFLRGPLKHFLNQF